MHGTALPCKEVSLVNRNKGKRTDPVPRPAMMMGCILSGGNFMTLGLIETVTFCPAFKPAKYLVHCPNRGDPSPLSADLPFEL